MSEANTTTTKTKATNSELWLRTLVFGLLATQLLSLGVLIVLQRDTRPRDVLKQAKENAAAIKSIADHLKIPPTESTP